MVIWLSKWPVWQTLLLALWSSASSSSILFWHSCNLIWRRKTHLGFYQLYSSLLLPLHCDWKGTVNTYTKTSANASVYLELLVLGVVVISALLQLSDLTVQPGHHCLPVIPQLPVPLLLHLQTLPQRQDVHTLQVQLVFLNKHMQAHKKKMNRRL